MREYWILPNVVKSHPSDLGYIYVYEYIEYCMAAMHNNWGKNTNATAKIDIFFSYEKGDYSCNYYFDVWIFEWETPIVMVHVDGLCCGRWSCWCWYTIACLILWEYSFAWTISKTQQQQNPRNEQYGMENNSLSCTRWWNTAYRHSVCNCAYETSNLNEWFVGVGSPQSAIATKFHLFFFFLKTFSNNYQNFILCTTKCWTILIFLLEMHLLHSAAICISTGNLNENETKRINHRYWNEREWLINNYTWNDRLETALVAFWTL